MKANVIKIIANPITLILSFSIVLIGSPYFGGPYLFFLLGSLSEGLAYGIVGIAGILVALGAIFFKDKRLPLLSNCLMILSLLIYFSGAPSENFKVTFFDIVPLATIIIFCFISVSIFIRTFSR